jgi:hypothetical protein
LLVMTWSCPPPQVFYWFNPNMFNICFTIYCFLGGVLVFDVWQTWRLPTTMRKRRRKYRFSIFSFLH